MCGHCRIKVINFLLNQAGVSDIIVNIVITFICTKISIV